MYCSTPINEWLFPPFLLCFYMAIALYCSYQTNFDFRPRAPEFRFSRAGTRPTNKIVNHLDRPSKKRTIIATRSLSEKRKNRAKYSLLLYFKMLEYLQSLNRQEICQLSRKLKIEIYLKAPLNIPLRQRIKTSDRLRAEIQKVFRISPQIVLAAIAKNSNK